MGKIAELAIGTEVYCEERVCGDLRRVVVDPVKITVTHLVVDPRHAGPAGRLVPVDLIDTANQPVRLRCTMDEFEALDVAEQTRSVSDEDDQADTRRDQVLSLPFFALGTGGPMGGGHFAVAELNEHETASFENVPAGEVEVQRGEHVRASDGAVGHVRGLAVDPSDYRVTHVLLAEGHLWGHKQVAIPISAVAGVDPEGVRLGITKGQVRDLPSVDLGDDRSS
jgi:hypothetical protein